MEDKTLLTEPNAEYGEGQEKPNAFDSLETSDKFVMQRVVDSTHTWHDPNIYKIAGKEEDLQDSPDFVAEEHGKASFWRSVLCCNQRKSDIKLIDKSGNIALWLEHPGNCNWPILCPGFRPLITIRSSGGHVIGHVEHIARETLSALLSPSLYYEVTNSNGKVVFKIEGPSCKFELFKTAVFRVFSPDFNAYIGDISHEWQGTCDGFLSCCFTDQQDKTTITFPKELEFSEKALLIGGLVLTHLNYYEQV